MTPTNALNDHSALEASATDRLSEADTPQRPQEAHGQPLEPGTAPTAQMATEAAQKSPSTAQADVSDPPAPSAGHHPDPNDLDQELVDSFGRLLTRLGKVMAPDDQGMAVWGMKAFDGRWEPLPPLLPSELPKVNRGAVKKSFDPKHRLNVYFRYPLFCGEAPTGTEKEAVAVPALVSDFDGGTWTVERVRDALTLPPSFIVETSPGNFQAHLILDRPVGVATARYFATRWNNPNSGVDGASFKPVQAWRLPGSINWGSKDKVAGHPDTYPYQTHLVWSPNNALPDEVDPASVEVLLELWGDAPSSPATSPLPRATGSDRSETGGGSDGGGGVIANTDARCKAQRLLGVLREGERLNKPVFEVPDDRAVWIAGATGIKAECGEHGREFFHAWSALSDKYDREEADHQWDTLNPNGSKGVGHLFDQARANDFYWSTEGIPIGPGALNGIQEMVRMTVANVEAMVAGGSHNQNDQPSTEGEALLKTHTIADMKSMARSGHNTDLVQGLLFKGTVAHLYGSWGSGKTLVASHLAECVARERPWFGKEVRGGAVLMLVSEDSEGLGWRLVASGASEDNDHLPIRFAAADNLFCVPSLDAAEMLTALIKREAEDIGRPVQLVILDTLLAAARGVDLNSMEEMGKIEGLLKQVAHNTKACVLVVHHSGKDQGRGMLGSIVANTNSQTVLKAEAKNGRHCVHVEKNKRGPQGYDLGHFEIDALNVGETEWHRRDGTVIKSTVTAPVLREADSLAGTPGSTVLSDQAKLVLEVLKGLIQANGVPIQVGPLTLPAIPVAEARQQVIEKLRSEQGMKDDAARQAWRRSLDRLAPDHIGQHEDHLYLAE
ncbi:AAA family ATPase [Thalassobaculum litoreum]|uniref:Primase C terminal 2 (PriCT-2) n=1 Tax=Thalassobaculum litoreum DSM 18839 TaxID=1123362 RepID=A0A8G2BFP2_9PROT|nr:AAA family ATPase [Thalassobaculum litoreum]SDF32161.1 Primase C terminal 2 (PriCT-2) [Thalassobaculum litoreum DSM 18839]